MFGKGIFFIAFMLTVRKLGRASGAPTLSGQLEVLRVFVLWTCIYVFIIRFGLVLVFGEPIIPFIEM